MAEELLVVLNRSEHSGFGFSLLGEPGLPPIIYNILEDSPAAESGEVQVGDVILKVNETDVLRYSTKEDPKIKASVCKHLLNSVGGAPVPAAGIGGGGGDSGVVTPEKPPSKIPVAIHSNLRPEPAVHRPTFNNNQSPLQQRHLVEGTTNGSCTEQEPQVINNQQQKCRQLEKNERLQWQPLSSNEVNNTKPVSQQQPKFEAYMMTGEHILNISRIPQTTAAILPKQQKKADNPRYHNSHTHHMRGAPPPFTAQHNSLPNSPNERDLGHRGAGATTGGGRHSAAASPIVTARRATEHQQAGTAPPAAGQQPPPGAADGYNYVRTSRSEDQLQGQNDLCSVSVANSEADEDVTSSLNTLLDTRPDSAGCSDSDRIVWTYNAPISDQHKFAAHALSNGSSSSHSPDYRDDDDSVMRDCVMEISDHSDSDSTLLVSEPRQNKRGSSGSKEDHRIVIQVKGPHNSVGAGGDKDSRGFGFASATSTQGNQDQDLLETEDECGRELAGSNNNRSSPLSSEDESDVESLHSFHYSPKAVDMPSAIRLAKRLYSLDGFKKSDVSRHLSKNNDFSRAVAEEYLKYFDFEKDTLDIALRKFLKQFSLTGETQERERVLVHFSKRYLDCNPGSFNSQDAVHTLTCAIMLLNTDLHGQNIGRKMTCNEFIENLAGLNECENFPREVLKQLYHAIKNYPLEWALDEENEDGNVQSQMRNNDVINLGGNPFLDVPISANAIEYKKGYVMRKCCYEANAKRSVCCLFLAPFHKRGWKMFYCTLRDLVLYLHKDENGFRRNQIGGDNLHNAIRIHHALATKATDYTKKQYVFRLQTADQAEYLFQTSDSKELQSWIDTINFVCASFSAPPLEAAVGSQKKFQRPLLPCSHTKLNLREQLTDHEERVMRLESMLEEHRRSPPEKGAKSQVVQNYKEKEVYLNYELKRYRTYTYILRTKLSQYLEMGATVSATMGAGACPPASLAEVDEGLQPMAATVAQHTVGGPETEAEQQPKSSPTSAVNRYSYRQAIYSGGGGGR
ncbi:unnamed protein product [Acanthoscelides obtectus]|uniref:PH and SEC7 domain-containing protein 4 n=1 Tax=Acanthoscelides obtectus TaxID=200917 RepID=A0A9P0PYI3_ACAOB|nr:unnamed protein product [Acanthoscelides obtectus]CAK1642414.1 PH and SEC7 domain-containing protein 3 [Acanthoscelides obtectus]